MENKEIKIGFESLMNFTIKEIVDLEQNLNGERK